MSTNKEIQELRAIVDDMDYHIKGFFIAIARFREKINNIEKLTKDENMERRICSSNSIKRETKRVTGA